MKVTAIAQRSGGWWAVSVPEVPGANTQARRLDQIPAMVADVVSLMEDIDPTSIDVQVVPEVAEVNKLVTEIRQAKDIVDHANASVFAATRAAAAELVHLRKFTVRDAGALMGVSAQRVSQLLKDVESVKAQTSAVRGMIEGARKATEDVRASSQVAKIAAAQAAVMSDETRATVRKATEGHRRAMEHVRAAMDTPQLRAVRELTKTGLPGDAARQLAVASAAAQQASIEATLVTTPRPPVPASTDETVTIPRRDYEALMQALEDAQDRLAVLEDRLDPEPTVAIEEALLDQR